MSEEIKSAGNNVDYAAIKEAYLDVYYYQLKQANGLLGEFSHDGKYQLKDEQLVKALLSIPKQFQEKEGSVVRAATKMGRYVLNFKVDLDLAESYCSARLFFYEIEHSVDGQDIKHETELDYVVNVYSPLFVSDVYKKWNIHTKPVEIEKDDPVLKYLESQERDFEFAKELSELLSQVYLIRLLKILEKCGPEGQKILAEYNAFLKKYGKAPGSPDYYTLLKKKLDDLIIKNKAVSLVLANGGDVAVKGFVNPINSIRGIEPPAKTAEGAPAPVIASQKKEEVKPAAKKQSSGSKPKKDKPKDKPKDKGKDKDKGKGGGGGGGTPPKPTEKEVSPKPTEKEVSPKPTEKEVSPKPTEKEEPLEKKEDDNKLIQDYLNAMKEASEFMHTKVVLEKLDISVKNFDK